MTTIILRRPQARALARRVRGLHFSEPDDHVKPPKPADEAPASAEALPASVAAQQSEDTSTSPLGTQPASRPDEPEIYRPSAGAGSYSLTGEGRAATPDPIQSARKPLVAAALRPALSDELLTYLRGHLDAGETHYTPRPGIPELRRHVARALAALGGPDLDEDGIVITAGEGEALFATLMGLGLGPGDEVFVSGDWKRHKDLFDILGVVPLAPGDADPGSSGPGSPAQVIFIGCAIPPGSTTGVLPLPTGSHLIYIGSLNALPEMTSFRLGYAAGPAERISRIMTWKQAFSICCAAPSQRAALFGFAGHGKGGQAGKSA